MKNNKVLNCNVFMEHLYKSKLLKENENLNKNEVINKLKSTDKDNLKNVLSDFIPSNIDFISSLKISELVGRKNYQNYYIEDFVKLLDELDIIIDINYKYSFFNESKHYSNELTDSSVFTLIKRANVKHHNIFKGVSVPGQIELEIIKESGYDPFDPKLKLEINPEVILSHTSTEDLNYKQLFANLKGTFKLDMRYFTRFFKLLNGEDMHSLLRHSKFDSEIGLVMFEQVITSKEYNEGELLNDLLTEISKNKFLEDNFVLELLDLLNIEEVLKRNPFKFETYDKIFEHQTDKFPAEDLNFTVHDKNLTETEVIELVTKYKPSTNPSVERNFSLVMYKTINAELFSNGYNSATYFFRDEEVRPYHDLSNIDNLNYIYDVLRGRLVLKDNYFDCVITNLNLDKINLSTISKKVIKSNFNPAIQILSSNKPKNEKVEFIKRTKLNDTDTKISEILKINKDLI